ncbi:MAG: beta-N-acetylhexosaminidase [Dokdonia sp.]|nr:beta-N-acetylhexosaminidase [Dokdonia sp.]
MIRFFALCAILLLCSCTNALKEHKNSADDYPVIPKPLELTMESGRFLIDDDISIQGPDLLINEMTFLNDILKNNTGKSAQLLSDGTLIETSKNIFLSLSPTMEGDESYSLQVGYDAIHIEGKTAQGVFHGIQTLRQLIPIAASSDGTFDNAYTIPCVQIKDQPAFSYRGMHLDVGRHFFPVPFIKKYIDILSLHKMNTFHWHLTEDQGWRIEIKKYPKLTSVGSQRKETILEKNFNPFIGDSIPYGGFYTQEEIKEVVAYAAQRHITIIPEIELPGHSLAAIAAYPSLGNTSTLHEVGTRWGVYDAIYAPSEETFSFLEDVLTEVIALFPSKLIHIGGDEAPKKEWNESAFAQEVMKREDLKDAHELQSYFIQRIEKFLNSKGRNIIGWDEILEGGLAPNATVMSWRGTQGGIDAANQKHNVIMTPGSHCYFDHYQVDKDLQKDEPLAIGGYTSVEKVYGYNPIPEELAEEQHRYILGAQGNVWTEYILTPEHVEYMVLPRLTALSEVLWTSNPQKNWPDFKDRLSSLKKRYDHLDYTYAPHVFRQSTTVTDGN